jgi:hypothetical protein
MQLEAYVAPQSHYIMTSASIKPVSWVFEPKHFLILHVAFELSK